jgi:hypothetical protein
MYLVGTIIGLIIFSLTYLFSRNLINSNRVVVVLLSGIISLLLSLTFIGGFEGMPFGVLSIGIITTSILFSFFSKSPLWKKSIYTFLILSFISYNAFLYFNKVDYWIVKKTHYYSSYNEVSRYLQSLQENTEIKGYKTFRITEGNKGVVLSLGDNMAGNNIEILDVKEEGKTTIIKIKTFYNQSQEKNPVVMVGLHRLQPEVIIMDTDGTIYEKVM